MAADLVVIELDTPGGLDTSAETASNDELTRRGIDLLASAVPLLKKAGAQRLIAINPVLTLTSEQEQELLCRLPDKGEMKSALRSLRRAASTRRHISASLVAKGFSSSRS